MGNLISSEYSKPTSVSKPVGAVNGSTSSNFAGKQLRAVIVGINYSKTSNPLSGCINDAELMRTTLSKRSFTGGKETLYLNDESGVADCPTKDCLVQAIQWLLSGNSVEEFSTLDTFDKPAKANTVLLFYYAGHGYHVQDTDGDEADGQDEVLCPVTVDGKIDEYLTDDEIKLLVSQKLRKDLYLIVLTDSCHSGTVVDLKYKLNGKRFVPDYKYTDTVGNVIHLGACRDYQTAAEGQVVSGERHGYFTHCFCEAVRCSAKLDLVSLNRVICHKMRKYITDMNQLPRMNSGKNVSVYTKFPL